MGSSTDGMSVDAGDRQRYAEYGGKTNVRSVVEINRQLARVGLHCRHAFQLWKPLGKVFSDTVKKMSTSAFSSYYKGGFDHKMSKREASLILGVSPVSTKGKLHKAHLQMMVLNHPDKAKDLLEKEMRR